MQRYTPDALMVTLPGPFNAGTFAPAVLWLVPDVSVPDGEALPAPPQPARHVSRSAAVSRIDNAFFHLVTSCFDRFDYLLPVHPGMDTEKVIP